MPKTKPRTLVAYEVVNRADPTMDWYVQNRYSDGTTDED